MREFRCETPADLAPVAMKILETLGGQSGIVWLLGEMGAGKTTLVAEILRQRGLSEATPVLSPTFTLMNEYEIDGDWFAHLDLYRTEEGFRLEELGVFDARHYHWIFIEWPQKVEQCARDLACDWTIEIQSDASGVRHIRLR